MPLFPRASWSEIRSLLNIFLVLYKRDKGIHHFWIGNAVATSEEKCSTPQQTFFLRILEISSEYLSVFKPLSGYFLEN